MIVGLALPKRVYLEQNEVAVTFVVPAENGCNMSCSFCAIRARAEAKPGQTVVGIVDYVAFLRASAQNYNVGVVSLQGYEPLLPESWAYTDAILRAANELGLRTALVTNGSYLADRAAALRDLGLGSLSVSIDAATAEVHDRSRGTPGALAMTVRGLRAAIDRGLADRITIASVMQRGRADLLDGMPEFVAGLGLKRWVVTPVQSFGRVGGTVDTASYILGEGKRLYIASIDAGIDFELDDELEALLCESEEDHAVVAVLRERRVQRADQIIRLSPSGAVSRGAEIRRRVSEANARWNPRVEEACHLLQRLEQTRKRPLLQLVSA